MESWFEVAQVILAVAVFGYVFWLLAFSGREESRRLAAERQRKGFERRAAERAERRNVNLGAPGGTERRVGTRRVDDG